MATSKIDRRLHEETCAMTKTKSSIRYHLREGGVLAVHLVLALVVDERRAAHYELRAWHLFAQEQRAR